MRIVTREQFLALPPPVLYAKMHKDCIDTENMEIKIRNVGDNDWHAITLDPTTCVDSEGSTESIELIFAALEDPTLEIPLNFYTSCRDGSFDSPEDVKFAILSKDDLVSLIFVLTKLLDKTTLTELVDEHKQDLAE